MLQLDSLLDRRSSAGDKPKTIVMVVFTIRDVDSPMREASLSLGGVLLELLPPATSPQLACGYAVGYPMGR